MNQNGVPKISKWPFLAGDLLLLATAGWLAWSGTPLDGWRIVALPAAVGLGAWLAVLPFVLQFRADMKLAEAAAISDAAVQIGNLGSVAKQIAGATAEWQHIHQSATQAVTAAEHIAERMTVEARNFGEALGRMNESEKQHLRLEIDKLRRAEGEWLQMVVRMLDHVFALYRAGLRSGQSVLVEQLTSFQNACRDTVRRAGLTPILPSPDAPYDPAQHQLFDGQVARDGALIAEILAPGYTFQGQRIRLPLVTLREENTATGAAAEPAPQEQLAFPDSAANVSREKTEWAGEPRHE